jgi:hypothetical protein
MSMEKYGVSDKAGLQQQELSQIRQRLAELRTTLEKTADQTQEIERLEAREAELNIALADH